MRVAERGSASRKDKASTRTGKGKGETFVRRTCSTEGSGAPCKVPPLAMSSARPSATAVLPVPGSPRRMGLFLRRRARIWQTRTTSASRPITCTTTGAAFF